MNKKTTFLALMSLFLVGGLGLTACSDNNNDLDDVVNANFAIVDVNGNLVATRAEWDNAFVVFDTDNDGNIEITEFPFNATLFDLIDVNHDGVITTAEWDAGFAVINTNNDDVVQQAEISVFF